MLCKQTEKRFIFSITFTMDDDADAHSDLQVSEDLRGYFLIEKKYTVA